MRQAFPLLALSTAVSKSCIDFTMGTYNSPPDQSWWTSRRKSLFDSSRMNWEGVASAGTARRIRSDFIQEQLHIILFTSKLVDCQSNGTIAPRQKGEIIV